MPVECHINNIILEGGEILIRDFPLPPSSNSLYRNIKNGRAGQLGRAKTEKYKLYCDDVAMWAIVHGKTLKRTRSEVNDLLLIHKTLQIDATFCIAESRCYSKDGKIKKIDTFNHIKALHDQLSEVLWVDDRFFWDGNVRRQPCDKKSERVIIRIKGRQ